MSDIRNRAVEILKKKADQHQKQAVDLEKRRLEVVENLISAAIEHGLAMGQDTVGEYKLFQRVEQSATVRVSEAEAMVQLAEFNGDIVSPIQWWQIRGSKKKSDVVMWQGYALEKYLHYEWYAIDYMDGDRFRDLSKMHMDGIEFIIRMACTGEYITAVMEGFKTGVAGAVGISYDKVESIKRAYLAYFNGVCKANMEEEDIPNSLLDRVKKTQY